MAEGKKKKSKFKIKWGWESSEEQNGDQKVPKQEPAEEKGQMGDEDVTSGSNGRVVQNTGDVAGKTAPGTAGAGRDANQKTATAKATSEVKQDSNNAASGKSGWTRPDVKKDAAQDVSGMNHDTRERPKEKDADKNQARMAPEGDKKNKGYFDGWFGSGKNESDKDAKVDANARDGRQESSGKAKDNTGSVDKVNDRTGTTSVADAGKVDSTAWNSKHSSAANTEHKTENSKHGSAANTEHKTENSKHGSAANTEHSRKNADQTGFTNWFGRNWGKEGHKKTDPTINTRDGAGQPTKPGMAHQPGVDGRWGTDSKKSNSRRDFTGSRGINEHAWDMGSDREPYRNTNKTTNSQEDRNPELGKITENSNMKSKQNESKEEVGSKPSSIHEASKNKDEVDGLGEAEKSKKQQNQMATGTDSNREEAIPEKSNWLIVICAAINIVSVLALFFYTEILADCTVTFNNTALWILLFVVLVPLIFLVVPGDPMARVLAVLSVLTTLVLLVYLFMNRVHVFFYQVSIENVEPGVLGSLHELAWQDTNEKLFQILEDNDFYFQNWIANSKKRGARIFILKHRLPAANEKYNYIRERAENKLSSIVAAARDSSTPTITNSLIKFYWAREQATKILREMKKTKYSKIGENYGLFIGIFDPGTNFYDILGTEPIVIAPVDSRSEDGSRDYNSKI